MLSAKNVWAVGDYTAADGTFRTLIVHWNGEAWSRAASPNPGTGSNSLSGIDAVSPSNIWAVGLYAGADIRDRSLILHWNGHAWSRVASPNPGKQSDSLAGLSGVSGSSLWTTELYTNSSSSGGSSQIVHWNGHTWKRVATPNLKPNQLGSGRHQRPFQRAGHLGR